MHYREDAYRMAYELRAPNHRLTPELLQHLEVAAYHVTRYPPIHLSVYHMATQELHAIPDHDVYVNTREMTYCVELHETPGLPGAGAGQERLGPVQPLRVSRGPLPPVRAAPHGHDRGLR